MDNRRTALSVVLVSVLLLSIIAPVLTLPASVAAQSNTTATATPTPTATSTPTPTPDDAPVAKFSVSDDWVDTGETFYVDASESENADRYLWDFTGDGDIDATGVRANWSYSSGGTNEITLIVTQTNRGGDETSGFVRVLEPEDTPTATPTETPSPTPTPAETSTPTPEKESPPTATQTPTPDAGGSSGGEYSLSRLSEGGRNEGVDNLESVRSLGDPPNGFAAARYRDRNLFDVVRGNPGDWSQIQQDSLVEDDSFQLYGSAFGDSAGEYTLVIVFWERETVQRDNGTERIAANQSVQTQSIVFDENELYSYHNVSLPSHLGSSVQTTMWLERNGEPLDGVKWRFSHRSNPESTGTNIQTSAGAWGFAFANAVLPGIVSVIIGLFGARITLKRIGRGAGYGPVAWILILTVIGSMVATAAYYQIAVILHNVPIVMGLLIGVVAFASALTFHDPVQKIGFYRRELLDAETAPGLHSGPAGGAEADGGVPVDTDGDSGAEMFDEFTEALYSEMPTVPAVRTEDGYKIPVEGIRPAIARLFASAAILDLSAIKTREKVKNGPVTDIIQVDPLGEEAVVHEPATLKRVLPVDTLADDASTGEKALAYAMTAAIVAAPAAFGAWALEYTWGIPSVGVLIGLSATIVMAYSAEDGWIDFTAAPPHYKRAEDSLTVLQRAYKKSAEEERATKEIYKERAKTADEARRESTTERKVVTDHILDSIGAGSAVKDGGEEAVFESEERDSNGADDEDEEGGGE